MNFLLSPQQLAQLLPLVPSLLQWLRSTSPKTAGDLFLADADMGQVQSTLKELLNAQNFNYHLTGVQLRYICSCHSPDVWAAAIRLLVAESDPRFVLPDVAHKLLSSLQQVHKAGRADEVSMILGPALDMLPRSHYVGLGEFCALIRDTSSDSKQLACLVGPMLLVPRTAVSNQQASSAAAAIMDLLVEEAETIFGKPGGYCRKDAFGVRRAMPNLASKKAAVKPPPGLMTPGMSPAEQKAEMMAARDQKRRQQLKAYYQWKDPEVANHVATLFDSHDFPLIAEAILAKYGGLPPGWKTDLLDLKASGTPGLEWFKEGDIGLQKTKNQAGRPISIVRGFKMTKKKSGTEPTKIDKIVNEIIETEVNYHASLGEMLEHYVKVIRAISAGEKGKQAEIALGLTQAQVEQIFGTRLEEIVSLSHRFLGALEVVSLIRSPPKAEIGRAGLVAQAFSMIAPSLHVYSPYVSAHKSSFGTLDKAMKEDKRNKSSQKSIIGSAMLRKKEDAMTFIKLWSVVSNSSDRLRGQSLQSLLMMPIQRIPRYKLLLGELIKGTDASHPSMVVLKDALETVAAAAKDINEALRQHEKLGKFFGADDLIAPSFSSNSGERIRNGYVDNA